MQKARDSLESKAAWIKVVRANIRESNNTSARVKETLWQGTPVYIQNSENEWDKVLYDGPIDITLYDNIDELAAAYKSGWIHKSLVSDNPIDSLSYDEERRWTYVIEHPNIAKKFKDAIVKGAVILGMNQEMVTLILGDPDEVNRTVSGLGVHEQWVYRYGLFYFEDGILTAWQD